MLLLLSVFALFLGPLTYRLLQRQPGWLDLLDAFIFVTISGLVLFHILPELLHRGGLIVLLLVALGVFLPSWVEKYFHKAAHQAHQMTLFLGVLGLVIHASIDGSVLIVAQGDQTGWLLAIGVLLHRFPVGLTIWWLLRPQYGRLLPTVVLLSMSVATLAGGFWASDSLAQLDGQWLAWFQGFVMGSILHVVLHRPYLSNHNHAQHLQEATEENRYAAGIGSVFGLIVLACVLLPHWLGYIEHHHEPVEPMTDAVVQFDQEPHLHQEELNVAELHNQDDEHEGHDEHESHDDHHNIDAMAAHEDVQNNTALTLLHFINIALYSAPMLLLAYFFSGIMHYFKPKFAVLPTQTSQTFFKDALRGVFYGLPLPVCIPTASKIHQQLLARGSSQTFATAFLIAAPIIGFDALFLSLPLLGTQVLLLRIVLAAGFALLIAWLLGRHFKVLGTPSEPIAVCEEHTTSRFIRAIKLGYQHQLDHTAPWVLLGWAIAATFSATSTWIFFEQALWLQILVMIVIAFPFALCATGITPVIAVMLIAGLSPGAAIAFFLIAPTISLELLKTVKQQQGFFAATSLAMLMLSSAFLIGLGLNQYIDIIELPWLAQAQKNYSGWQLACLLIILSLYLASLLRRGARSFIAELIPKSFLSHRHH